MGEITHRISAHPTPRVARTGNITAGHLLLREQAGGLDLSQNCLKTPSIRTLGVSFERKADSPSC